METINNYNMVTLIGETLEERLKNALLSEVMDRLVSEFKANAEPVVKAEVEKVTLTHVEKITDVMKMRDELVVHLKWKGE